MVSFAIQFIRMLSDRKKKRNFLTLFLAIPNSSFNRKELVCIFEYFSAAYKSCILNNVQRIDRKDAGQLKYRPLAELF